MEAVRVGVARPIRLDGRWVSLPFRPSDAPPLQWESWTRWTVTVGPPRQPGEK